MYCTSNTKNMPAKSDLHCCFILSHSIQTANAKQNGLNISLSLTKKWFTNVFLLNPQIIYLSMLFLFIYVCIVE